MDTEYFKDLLRTRDLKATKPRLSLLSTMHGYETAMPYSAIQESMESMDRVTLYRTLESLKKSGIIHKAFQDNNETYYAICGHSCNKDNHAHDHIHFKCVQCESVTCEKPSTPLKVSMPGFDINTTSVYVEGVCKSCKAA